MANDPKKLSPERQQTDESLRKERANSDQALVENQAAVDGDADLVVLRARENADAVLEVARERADQQAEQPAPRAVITEERVLEDETLADERAAADAALRLEREESASALSQLLPLERDKTDKHLLTERVRSDAAVSHRDDFLGMASHDLRNLLAGIVMSATLLAKQVSPGTPEGKQAHLGTTRIHRYAARMNRLIGDLVDVASIDAGRLAVAAAVGDATPLLAEAVDTFQAAATAKGIRLQKDPVAVPLRGEFDHDRVLQVLANLITNAIKFTNPGGSIRVHGESVGDVLRFSIVDTGMGIPIHMLEAVFERFWQVGKNDRRGVGLGLYISRCIVEAHGGKIWAESTLGSGSTFWFTLPRQAAAA